MENPYLNIFVVLLAVTLGIMIMDMIQRAKRGDLFTSPKGKMCRVYENSAREGEGELATFHRFIQDYMEGKEGVVYFPAVIVEFENGALETVPVNHIMMEKA